MSNWRFVTNHLGVLIQVAKHPQITMREIGARLGITERAVFRIISDLETKGYLTRVRNGRVNHYRVNPDLPLSSPELQDVLAGGLLLHLLQPPPDKADELESSCHPQRCTEEVIGKPPPPLHPIFERLSQALAKQQAENPHPPKPLDPAELDRRKRGCLSIFVPLEQQKLGDRLGVGSLQFASLRLESASRQCCADYQVGQDHPRPNCIRNHQKQ
jgi:biotin operon repressor